MHVDENPITAPPKRVPWNKGKLIGPRPPLRQKHVWAIRTRLQLERQSRDLALFNLAIDSKLRGCDLVAILVDDVAPHGIDPEVAVRLMIAGLLTGIDHPILGRWRSIIIALDSSKKRVLAPARRSS